MVDIKYANACSEVIEILKYISIEDYNKIPKSKIKVFEKNANSNYKFRYDPDKTLEEQNVSEYAQTIIGILFRDYWATPEQREKIVAFQKHKRYLIEEEKKKKYNVDDIFKKEKDYNDSDLKNEKDITKSLISKSEKENVFKKIFRIIKEFFNYKN